ncbi:MAG TPA: hypothetical protein VF778_04870 [Xanthobacteraceae bacterium]
MRTTVSHIRLCITVLGCAVLAASLFDWALALRATEHGYAWVGAESSSAPALETAEIWQASAGCERPYFVRAALQSKARLKTYYDLAPDEVRAWQNRSSRGEILKPTAEQQGLYRFASTSDQDVRRRNAEMEYEARLHAQHAEWYATVYKLEILANQWEHRLNSVSDQKVIIGEATRASFEATATPVAGPANSNGNFESHVLSLLGLGGFPGDEEKAIEADCVQITPVKKILHTANYFHEIWRWPVDRAAAFAIGSELLLIALLLPPIVIWLVTGDPEAAKRYMRRAVRRFVTRVRTFHKNKLIVRSLAVISAGWARARAFLTTLFKHRAGETSSNATFGALY